jgi:hypothetical protein
MDRQKSEQLRKQIEEVLNASPIAEEYSVEIGHGLFGTNNLQLKINFLEKVGGQAISSAEIDWKRYARSFDLNPEWLGKTFEEKGIVYKIIGLKPGRRKYPVLTSYRDGSTLWKVEFIQRKMSGATAAKIADLILKESFNKENPVDLFSQLIHVLSRYDDPEVQEKIKLLRKISNEIYQLTQLAVV